MTAVRECTEAVLRAACTVSKSCIEFERAAGAAEHIVEFDFDQVNSIAEAAAAMESAAAALRRIASAGLRNQASSPGQVLQ